MRIFFLPGILLLLLTSCLIKDKKPAQPPAPINVYQPGYNMISEAQLLVKDGDLLVRNGEEFSSQLIKQFNRSNKKYSHAGLVFFKDGYPLVYHIVPGDESPDLKLRTDSFKNFCNPRKNAGFALYRYNLDTAEISSLKNIIGNWYAAGVSFDSTFNYATDDKMYCSEMIAKGLNLATKQRIQLSATRPTNAEAVFFSNQLHLPLTYTKKIKVVAIDNLFINPYCKNIRTFDFKHNQ